MVLSLWFSEFHPPLVDRLRTEATDYHLLKTNGYFRRNITRQARIGLQQFLGPKEEIKQAVQPLLRTIR